MFDNGPEKQSEMTVTDEEPAIMIKTITKTVNHSQKMSKSPVQIRTKTIAVVIRKTNDDTSSIP